VAAASWPSAAELQDPLETSLRSSGRRLPDPEEVPRPADDPREGWGLDALGSRLLERAVVVFERDGRREAGILDDLQTGVWRCGHCRRGTVTPGPDEFLPRTGRLCPLCRAAIVVARVGHRDGDAPSFWRRLLGRGRRPPASA
jgi:hypothetical protein